MKFDKTVTLKTTSKAPDGMGGWTTTPVDAGTIACFTTPVKSEVLLKEYGIVSTSALKLFTKDLVPVRDTNGKKQTITATLENGIEYKILQYADFGKIRMVLVEEII
jgi:hypothetical protein